MSWIEKFLRWTAWQMDKPPAYGAFHLGFFFCGLAVVILLAFILRKTNDKQNRIVLLCCGLFLLLTELYKQLFYYYVIGNGTYQWWIFPFQLCSVPMYMCLLCAFLPKGKLSDALMDFMLSFNLMGGFIAFLEPSGLMHEYWTLTLHAFVWHMTMIFVGLYLGFSGRAGRTLKGYRNSVFVFVGLCIVAFIINLLLWDVSAGDINMFYVGPRISPIIVFKDIAANWGWYVNTPIYILALSIAAFIFSSPFILWHRKHGNG